ncbi:hypothetical protein ACIP98_01820 [Streptomyces sp. NPDC088354]|uniref:hypothetical protein n=1 Tax=Streptomyces sp. NPDC088354 TaxID=3365856 RepID=UPI00382C81DB
MKLGKALAKGYAEETGEEPAGVAKEIDVATAVTARTASGADEAAVGEPESAEAAVR